MIGFDNPMVLWCAPIALAPLIRSPLRGSIAPSITGGPEDRLSDLIAITLKICGVTAILALIIGSAGPVRLGASASVWE